MPLPQATREMQVELAENMPARNIPLTLLAFVLLDSVRVLYFRLPVHYTIDGNHNKLDEIPEKTSTR